MATATKKKNTAGDGDGEDEKDGETALVDFNATDVKKVLKRAQKRGFITHDEVNALLPAEDMTSDQIEDVMSQISEMGIAVVESEEEAEAEGKALTKTTLCACTCAKWAPSSCSRVKAKSPLRSVSRPAGTR